MPTIIQNYRTSTYEHLWFGQEFIELLLFFCSMCIVTIGVALRFPEVAVALSLLG